MVVGDIVADRFLSGTISRVSREAPVFILRHDATDTFPGGAANTAANVASLGGVPVLVGLLGNDLDGRDTAAALDSCQIDKQFVITDDSIRTTAKVRVLGGQPYAEKKQVIRIDYENSTGIPANIVSGIEQNLEFAAKDASAIVLSDYGYGLCTDVLFAKAVDISKRLEIPLIVDSRYRLAAFAGATSATPNKEEAEAILGREFKVEDAEFLRAKLNFNSLLVTLGGGGVAVAAIGRTVEHIPAVGSTQPVDVTGAGDTVIAAYALGLASGLSPVEAAAIANHAGSIVVMKRRTSVATVTELEDSLRDHQSEGATAVSRNV